MDRFVRNSEVEEAPLLDESVLYDANSRKFCLLNITGSSIWERLQTPASVRDLVVFLCDRFEDAKPDAVEQDVTEIIRLLTEMRLINSYQETTQG